MKISKKAIAFSIGILFLIALLWKLDFTQIADKIRNMDIRLFAVSLFWIVLGQFAGYSKWWVMKWKTLPEKQMPLAAVYSSVYVTGMITPARTGDLLASFAWPSYQGNILAWSILNRILEGGMTLIVALLVLGLFFSSTLEGFRWSGLLIFSVFTVAGVLLIFNRKFGIWILGGIKSFLRKNQQRAWASKLLKFETHAEEQMRVFYDTLDEMRKAHALVFVILLTVAARFCTVFSNYYSLHALGAHLGFRETMGILALTWVSGFFAPTPNGLGIGDLPPSLLLSHMGYQAYAGSFVLINRLLEVLLMLGWIAVGIISPKMYKKAFEKENAGKK